LLATQHYDDSEPVNLGTGVEISIRDLALLIAGLVGFHGRIAWDSSKPNGQLHRCWDVSRAEKAFGFRARTELVDGLAETIAWYREKLSEERNHEQDHAGLPEH
jgi:GDP-L-fucose synthase